MGVSTVRTACRLAIAALLVLAPALAAAQTYTLTPTPFQTAFDDSGRIINNACVWTYSAGTSTPATTYSDTAGTPNLNPIRSNPAGRFTAYLLAGSNYKFVYESACTPPAHGSVLRTADNVLGTPGSSATVDVTGTLGESVTAGLCVYLSDGSGGKTAGLWYKCDSATTYSSLTPELGLALAAISSAAAGQIRIAGAVTGLSSLSVGASYYVGTTGALTSTAPANARFVGQADTATTIVLSANPPIQKLTNTAIASVALNTSVQGPFLRGCGFRATLTTGTPVTTADVTGATNVFIAPFAKSGWGAGACAFYDGSGTWTLLTSAEITVALGTLTAGLPYDIFCFNNSGVMACDAPVAWTNTTTRATALVLQDGIYVKSGTTTRRYMATFYTSSTTQTEDSIAKRFLWNYYNRVPRFLRVTESTDTWSYNTTTYRQANAAPANQLDLVVGVAESVLRVEVLAQVKDSGAAASTVSIGQDSTTTPLAGVLGQQSSGASNAQGSPVTAMLSLYPAVGRHFYAWLERGPGGATTTTWYGDNGDSTLLQSGIQGWIEE